MSRGLVVAVVGPDGAGKTTVGRRLQAELGLPAEYLYMGVNAAASNRLLPTTRLIEAVKARRDGASGGARRQGPSSGHGDAARRRRRHGPLGAFLSTARLTNRLAEELYRQWLAARGRRAGHIVILDRDFLLDYHASDVSAGAQRSLGRRVHGAFLLRLYQRPDFVVYLDAPPDVLFARKGEGTLEWLAQRRQDYQAALQLVPRYAIVNAARPIDEVVGEVVSVVRSAVEERSSSRGQTGARRNDR